MHPHATTIKRLGGTTSLGRLWGYTAQRVNRWRNFGIPVKEWSRTAKLCKARKIRVPRDIREFLA